MSLDVGLREGFLGYGVRIGMVEYMVWLGYEGLAGLFASSSHCRKEIARKSSGVSIGL